MYSWRVAPPRSPPPALLATGDAVRIFGCDGHRVSGDAELLILEMHADATG